MSSSGEIDRGFERPAAYGDPAERQRLAVEKRNGHGTRALNATARGIRNRMREILAETSENGEPNIDRFCARVFDVFYNGDERLVPHLAKLIAELAELDDEQLDEAGKAIEIKRHVIGGKEVFERVPDTPP